ncbi:MAG TPA: cytochrome ubiquinol oxidase subunit I, partial [Micromonosporaceae bacterium]
PVGYTINPSTGRARLTDIGAVLTNKVGLITFAHTISASVFTGAMLMLGIAMWHVIRRPKRDTQAFRSAAKIGAWTALAAVAVVFFTGDTQGKIMTDTQPMKIAAAEALYETAQPAPFSILTIGTLNGKKPIFTIDVPDLLSFLATGHFDGKVQGINNLEAQYQQTYGPGTYTPNIPVTYWGFRGMIGFGGLGGLVALLALWTMRRGRTPTSKWVMRAALLGPFLPLLGNSAGWIFTEMGRQPWIVFGDMRTSAGVSPSVSMGEVITSLCVFALLYGALAVIEFGLLVKYAKQGLPETATETGDEQPLAFAY